MSLLQISEPDEHDTKTKSKHVVGIDLGTTNSLIASYLDGKVVFFPDENGSFLIPSVVNYTSKNSCKVGSHAQLLDRSSSNVSISSVKRLLGKGLNDLDLSKYPQDISENLSENKKELLIKTNFGWVSPIKVSSEILVSLRKQAENYLNQPIDGAVITVPAYFDDGQRQATKDAARIAGINVLRLINEPTAAALAYGLETGDKGVYVVFDMGGGTFDVSVLRLSGGVFEVLATGGDSSLGGDDFDYSIVKCWLSNNNINFDDLEDIDLNSLLILSRKVKEELNDMSNDDDSVSVSWKKGENKEFFFTTSVKDFKEITFHLVDKAISACKKTLLDSNIENDSIDDVILVGGSTRLKVVRDAVSTLFNREPRVDINPDEVVAVGAALQADLLSGNKNHKKDWLLLDVLPLSLGIETMGGLVEKIVERNSSIPVIKSQEFTTFKDGQTSMSIHIVQGERDTVSNCRSLAKFEINNIPPKVAGLARIEVSFQIDADGLLSVTAIEKTTGTKASIDVRPSYGLSENEVTKMIQEGITNAYEDMDVRARREAKLELKRNVYALEVALNQDNNLLTYEEHKKILTNIAEANDLINSTTDNQELIGAMIDKLNLCSMPLVEKRMNKAISSAIVGKTVESVEKTTITKKTNGKK